jgi:hypothetical protein
MRKEEPNKVLDTRICSTRHLERQAHTALLLLKVHQHVLHLVATPQKRKQTEGKIENSDRLSCVQGKPVNPTKTRANDTNTCAQSKHDIELTMRPALPPLHHVARAIFVAHECVDQLLDPMALDVVDDVAHLHAKSTSASPPPAPQEQRHLLPRKSIPAIKKAHGQLPVAL